MHTLLLCCGSGVGACECCRVSRSLKLRGTQAGADMLSERGTCGMAGGDCRWLLVSEVPAPGMAAEA